MLSCYAWSNLRLHNLHAWSQEAIGQCYSVCQGMPQVYYAHKDDLVLLPPGSQQAQLNGMQKDSTP